MTQCGEGYCPPTLEKEAEDPKNKKPITIRIILCYDGTNNNRKNIAEREKWEAGQATKLNDDKKDAQKEFGIIDSSYDNGRTNIAIMEPHIIDGEGKGGYSIVVKWYVAGQGTFNLQGDSDNIGKGMGAGDSGVFERARQGIKDAFTHLNKKFLNDEKHPPEDFFIKQVDIDVFGFSRGAATARHAIHVMGYWGSGGHPLWYSFWKLGYKEIDKRKVHIIFAGLYDTVVSVNVSQKSPKWIANNMRDQRAVAKAKFALHLVAADEHRQDFPLHKITSAIKAGTGAEYHLPGVHSDIGGSYNLANEILLKPEKQVSNASIKKVLFEGSKSDCEEEAKKLIGPGHNMDLLKMRLRLISKNIFTANVHQLYTVRAIEGLEYSRGRDEKKVINRGRVSDLEEDMNYLIADGWYNNIDTDNPQITIEDDAWATAGRRLIDSPYKRLKHGSPTSGKLIVNRAGISSTYCYIPLKFMVEESRNMAIEFHGKLDGRINRMLAVVPEFSGLESSLRAYMAKKGKTGSKPEDWVDIKKAEKHYPGIKELRNKHLHMSSSFNSVGIEPGYTPRLVNNHRERFYYDG
jgi:hypothetical protein